MAALTREEALAAERYPNTRTYCGGVSQIAREAFINGYREAAPTWKEAHKVEDKRVNLLIRSRYGALRIGTFVEPGDSYIEISSIK